MTILKPLVAAAAALALTTGAVGLNAQTRNSASALLEAAIQKQWVSGDLVGAMRDYQAIVDTSNERRIAAQALWRLAQGQEQLGRLEDARRSYERLIAQYADEPALVGAARTRLEGLAEEDTWSEPALSMPVVAPNLELDPTTDASEYVAYLTANPSSRPIVFSDLAVFDPRNSETRRLVTAARSAAYPVVSPDGTRVAYMSWNGDLSETTARRRSSSSVSLSAAELRVVRMSGVGDQTLVPQLGVRWLRPFAWSADSSSILTLIERTSGLRQIALVAADTGDLRVIKETPWLSVQDMSLSTNGQVAAYQVPAPRGTREQYEFFMMPLNGSGVARAETHYTVAAADQRGPRLSADELALHVLNRTGFGPAPGDIERVKAMGIDAYIEEQLHPERIADPVVNEKIRNFRSLRMEIPELLEKSGPPVAIANRRRSTMFQRPDVLERAKAEANTPDAAIAARTSVGPRVLIAPDRPYDLESHTARVIRAVHSTRQLQEVMVDFWMNHFNVRLGDDQLTPSFEEQAIRANALGNFERLLSAVSHHPKMLLYLDNWISSAPADVIEQRIAKARESADADTRLAIMEREPFLKESKGLNENFGRELLELHTMGVGSGYTQQDIIEVARILSGWTIGSKGLVNGQKDDGVFMFDPMMHVDGDKVVLGQTFKSAGVDEGEQLLKMLAHRPETARFISTKLARRFIADTPPEAVIEAASRTFLQTGGDIREVVKTILMSPQFRSGEYVGVKIKKPFELVASSLRAVNATFEDLSVYAPLIVGNQALVSRMGEKMYNHEAPDGNPDVGPAWMNSNALLLRLQFASDLAGNKVRGVRSDLVSARAVLADMGIQRPTQEQLERHRALLEAQATPMPTLAGMRSSMMMGGGTGTVSTEPPIDTETLAVAFMLGSPQFQKR